MRTATDLSPVPGKSPQAPAREAPALTDILRLAELVPVVRTRIGVGRVLSDDAILLSLAEIERERTLGDRWSAAFRSELGRALSTHRGDLGAALGTVLALLAAHRPS